MQRTRHCRQFCLLLLIGLLQACGSGPQTDSLPTLDSGAVILAFGDSLTYGTGAKPAESYPSQLAALTGLQVINAGVPGDTTAGGVKRLPGLLSRHNPDLVILCLGGNDFLRRLDVAQTRHNLENMFNQLKTAGIPVLMLGVPQLGLSLTGKLQAAELYDELAKTHNLPLENDILPEVLSQPALKSDQIHPNADGYRAMADAIYARLVKAGALAP